MVKKFFFLLFVTTILFHQLFAQNKPPHTIFGYLPVILINNSKAVEDENVYILIKGIDPTNHKESYLRLDQNTGQGIYANAADAVSSFDYSYKLSSLPKTAEGHLVYLPPLTSGRIYFSIAYPMDLQVDPHTKNIRDPDALDKHDPNYYTLYDKIEFTYVSPGNPEIAMNPTAVDFFSLPLYLEMNTRSGIQHSGFFQKRADIFVTVKTIFAEEDKTAEKIWSNLIIPVHDPITHETIADLRIASPGKAMKANPAFFDIHYLSNGDLYGFNWIKSVWNTYYKSHTLNIDATELQPPHNKIFVGKVNSANQFVFTASDGSSVVTLNPPSDSAPFFEGAGDTFNALNNTPKAIIVRNLTAAFDTGILPVEINKEALNKNYFLKSRSKFYTNNPQLPLEGQNTGPWYDLYSKALHSFGNNIYSFAYDDVLGIDGTTTTNMRDNPFVTITLGNLQDTVITDPFTDEGVYTITVHVADTNPVTFQGQALTNNQTISNVKAPFIVELSGTDGKQHKAAIYLKYPLVRPSFPGSESIAIEKNSNNTATISFPAHVTQK